MAKEDIVKVLKVETGNSESTVKKLKDEIQKLNEQIKNTNTESGKLVTNNNQLGNAIDDTTGDIDQASKSYNSLVLQMKALKKEWRAATDEVQRASLGEKIVEVNNELKEMDATIGNFQRNVGNYEQSFSSAMSQMNQSIEPTIAKFDAIQKTAAGLTSGIAALTGTMALFGIENEDVQKSLLKVQSAMAIAQGVGGLKDLVEGLAKGNAAFGGLMTGIKGTITSLKGFKLALASTGIGLLITAIGTLIYYFSQLEDKTEKTKKSIEGLSKRTTKLLEDVDRQTKWKQLSEHLDKYTEALKKAGNNTEQLKKATDDYNASLKQLKKVELEDQIKILGFGGKLSDGQIAEGKLKTLGNAKIKAEEDYNEENSPTNRNIKKYSVIFGALGKYIANKKIGDSTESLKQTTAEYDATLKLLNEKYIELEELNNSIAVETAEKAIETAEAVRAAEEDKYNTIIEKLKEAKALQEEDLRLKEKERQLALQQQKNYLNNIDNVEEQKLYDSDVKFQTKEIDTSEYDLINLRIEALNEERRIRQEAFNERMFYYDELLANETLTVEESIALEKEKEKVTFKWNNEVKKMSLESLKLEKERNEQEVQLHLLKENAILDISKSFLASAEKISAENFWISRGLASAQAAIDTYQAANAAYAAMAGIPVVGPALGAAAAAAAIAAGLANVHQIWQIDEKGKETQSATSSAAATPSFNLSNSMPFQYSRNVLTDRELDEMNQPTRVYVLENDIVQAHRKVEVREMNATF